MKQCKKSYMRALKKEEERKKEPVEQSVADALTVRYQNKQINLSITNSAVILRNEFLQSQKQFVYLSRLMYVKLARPA